MRVKFGRINPLVDECKRRESRLSQFAESHDDAEEREGWLTGVAAAFSSPHCGAFANRRESFPTPGPLQTPRSTHQRPLPERAPPTLQSSCHSAISCESLGRSVIASVTAIDNKSDSLCSTAIECPDSRGQMAINSYQGSVRQNSTWVHPSAPACAP